MTKEKREVLSAQELAKILGVNAKTIYKHAQKSELPVIKLGRRFLFPKKALYQWLKSGKKPIVKNINAKAQEKELPLFK